MLPPSMRLVPFSTCLPDPKKRQAYRLATYEGRLRPLPDGFAEMGPSGGPADGELDNALLFLAERAEFGSAGEVFSEFDKTISPGPRAKIVLLSKVFGVPDSPESLRAGRARDLGRNAGSLLADLHGSPHARDVCDFFAATEGLHPGVLEFLSGRTHATRKHRRRVLDLMLPAALKERPGLVPGLFACGVLDWESKDDARDLLRMLGAVAESGAGSDLLADALASALGRRQPGKKAG